MDWMRMTMIISCDENTKKLRNQNKHVNLKLRNRIFPRQNPSNQTWHKILSICM